MRKIRIDGAHPKNYETTNGFLVRYKASLGYKRTLEHYTDKFKEGWEFAGNWLPHPRARELQLNSLDARVQDLSKTHEVYVGEIAFLPDGTTREDGRTLFTKPKVVELAETSQQ